MKEIVIATILIFFLLIGYGQENKYQPVQHFVFPKVQIENSDKPMPSQINRGEFQKYIFNYAYSACFDTEYNLPLWVSHHINSSLLKKNYDERPGGYPKDPQYPNLKSDAFSSSGYDHGHLAPAADFQWSKEAYLQSFLMTNMSPQYGCFNQKGWCHLEGTVRKWAEENPNTQLYIVSGAVVNQFIDTLCLPNNIKVFVPGYFYKVVLIAEPDKETKAIGYLIPNEDIETYNVQPYETTVAKIEELTGLDFFSFLPRELQDKIETVIPQVIYYTTKISCPDKSCESIYPSTRPTPQQRTKLKCR